MISKPITSILTAVFFLAAQVKANERIPEISDPLSANVVSKSVYTCVHGFPSPVQVMVEYSRIRGSDLAHVDRFERIVARGVPISAHLLNEINSEIKSHSIEFVYILCSSPDLQIKISVSKTGAAPGSDRLHTTLLIDERGMIRWSE